MIDVVLLGTGGMLPLPGRWLSSLLIRVKGEMILFDCGEGTQVTWRERGWGFRRLAAICISHTHADHIAGLPGLLHTAANSGRVEPIDLFGPLGTAEVVRGLRTIAPALPFALRVNELGGEDVLTLPGGLSGSYAEGVHGLPVLAYRVDLPRAREFLPDRARELRVPVALWRQLQDGEPVTWPGGEASPEQVLGPPRRGLSLAYVTDTRPTREIVNLVRDVDLLVCEGTYGDDEDREKAEANGHMTFREAGTIARDASVRTLWITHFSPSLIDPDRFARNAIEMFQPTTVGYPGLLTRLRFGDD
jgi:ribonuclease Z